MKAPNIKPLTDDSYLDQGKRGSLDPQGLTTFWSDVTEDNELYLEFGFPLGRRLVLSSACGIENKPDVAPGDALVPDYAWIIETARDGVWSDIIHEREYDGMLEVVYFKAGSIFRKLYKKGYNFSIDIRSDHQELWPWYNQMMQKRNSDGSDFYMILPPFSVDFYNLYTDITDLVPKAGEPDVKLVICPKVNYKGRWAEQNSNDNDVQIPIVLSSVEPYARMDNIALDQLIPSIPTNVRHTWHGSHLRLMWTGDAEWYEVKYRGNTARLTTSLLDDFKATGKEQIYEIRSGNRYRISNWIGYKATKKDSL